MALFFRTSYLTRTAILLCLFVGFAAPMLDAPRAMSATVLAEPPQAKPPAAGTSLSQAIQGMPSNDEYPPNPLTEKQRRDLVKANFEKMKHDAKELANLAKGLEDELNKSNENILSLDVVDKADKIEKLARKIKGTARGF